MADLAVLVGQCVENDGSEPPVLNRLTGPNAGRVEMNAAAATEDRSPAASGVIHFARFETMNECEIVKRCGTHF
jgi:hypothetical protein